MQIPEEIIADWKVLRSEEDTKEIAEIVVKTTSYETCSAETIRKVFRLGKCSDEIFKVMAAFYNERKELIATYKINQTAAA